METKKLGIGDYVSYCSDSSTCANCGRKVGKNPKKIHLSNSGGILNPNDEENPSSLGFWPIGSECAKRFESEVLVNN